MHGVDTRGCLDWIWNLFAAWLNAADGPSNEPFGEETLGNNTHLKVPACWRTHFLQSSNRVAQQDQQICPPTAESSHRAFSSKPVALSRVY